MRRFPFLVITFASLLAASMAIRATAQNVPGGSSQNSGGDGAPGGDGGPGGGGGQGGGQGGGPGGGPPPAGYHLLPRFVTDKLDLTDDQKQQLDQLEQDTKAKMAKILTADQMKIVNSARPPRRGGGGGQGGQQGGPGGDGGQGGGPGGGGGGPGGDQGPPN